MSRQFRSDDTSKWMEGYGTGANGDKTLTNGDIGNLSSTTGTAGQYTCTNQWNWNIDSSFVCILHQTRGTGAGAWEINKVVSSNPGTGVVTLKYPLQNTYTSGAQLIIFPNFNNVTINSTIVPPSWGGVYGGVAFVFAKTSINITGSINVVGNIGYDNIAAGATQPGGIGAGFRGGTGDAHSTNRGQYTGEGTAGAMVNNSGAANGNGGGALADNGAGGGGNAAAGTAGQGGGSAGGAAAGNAGLTSMVFGGGGGGGEGNWGNTVSGSGGAGGGIVILIAPTITISGSITASGGRGGNASTAGRDGSCGGGGGAGGSVLIKCKTATLGTNLITATGGAGGTSYAGRAGGAGSVGRIHIDYKTSYTGTTNPTIDARQDSSLDYPPAGGAQMIFGGGVAIA